MSFLTKHLVQSYESIGAFDADYVYIYSDLRYFSQYVEEVGGRDNFCREIIKTFIKRGQTVIMPTFTYTKSGKFNVLSTPTKLGALNSWILKQPQVQRSEHPLFSYAALGPKADFLRDIGKSAFGKDSVFDRLKGKNAVFLHIGRPIQMGNTLLHHVEQICGATYRINKAFNTKVYRGQEYIGTNYTAFLRRLDVPGEDFYYCFKKSAQALQDANMIKSVGEDSNFSTIASYRFDEMFSFLVDLFYKDQCVFIKSDFMQF